jgi:hypothetical protein
MSIPWASVVPVLRSRHVCGMLVCLLLAISPLSALGAEVIHDVNLSMTFVVPAGFVSAPARFRDQVFPYSFALDPENARRTILLRIRGTGERVIGNDVSDAEIASARRQDPSVERFAEHWRGTRVEGMRYTTDPADGVRRVHYDLILPTLPEAISILASGPESRDSEVREALKSLLLSLEATPYAPPTGRKPTHTGFVLRRYHLALAALVLLLAVVVGWRLLRRKRVPPPAASV